MYINHITLSTGHTRRSPRAEVSNETVAALQPWLATVIAHADDYPLPGPLGTRDGFLMSASLMHGGLMCHVKHKDTGPLVTFGVAARSRQSGELWAWLCAQYGSAKAIAAPGTPWCAVALHPGLVTQMDVTHWLGDFERCIAWTWLERAQ